MDAKCIVIRVLDKLPGLVRQPKIEQSRFKLSYFIDPAKAPSLEEINQLLHTEDQSVSIFLSFGQFLDIIPIRASKGLALRYMAAHWEISLERILVAGGSGADEDMMRGNTLAVVVGNRHHEELSQLEEIERIYFAKAPYASGILEAIDHYDFFHSCQLPESGDGRGMSKTLLLCTDMDRTLLPNGTQPESPLARRRLPSWRRATMWLLPM